MEGWGVEEPESIWTLKSPKQDAYISVILNTVILEHSGQCTSLLQTQYPAGGRDLMHREVTGMNAWPCGKSLLYSVIQTEASLVRKILFQSFLNFSYKANLLGVQGSRSFLKFRWTWYLNLWQHLSGSGWTHSQSLSQVLKYSVFLLTILDHTCAFTGESNPLLFTYCSALAQRYCSTVLIVLTA